MVVEKFKSQIQLNVYFAFSAMLVLIGGVGFIGNIVGVYVKEIGGFSESVWTKNEQFQNVVVIIATSHHTALLTKTDGVIVIPSTDITKMQAIDAR